MSSSHSKGTTYAAVVGQVLARARSAKGIPQAALAAELGVAQSVVSRVETGALPLTVDTLARWAAMLQMAPADVLASADAAVRALEGQGVRVLYQRPARAETAGLALIGAGAVGALIGLALAAHD